MNILLTGGTGFVGERTVKLLQKDFQIIVLTRTRKHNKKNLKFISVDIADREALMEKTKNVKISVIIHIGAFVPQNPFASLDELFQVNVIGTHNLIDVAKKHNVKKFIYVSSFSVYGTNDTDAITEEAFPNPANPYSLSKYCGEKLLEYYYKSTENDVVMLRCAGIYGEERKDGAVAIFISQALVNKQITIFHPSYATDIVYVGDVVQAIKQALTIKGFQIFNIASGEKRTTKQLAQDIMRLTNSQSKILSNKQSSGTRLTLHLDITKAKKELFFNPQTLEDYIRKNTP